VIARSVALVGLATLAAVAAIQVGEAPAPMTAQAAPPAALQTSPLSPRNASYEIAATLDPGTHAISAWQTLTWRNISTTPATSLQFHLYYNAWRNTLDVDARAVADRQHRPRTAPAGDWGWIDVTRVSVNGGPDVLSGLRFIAPDDGNPDDRTVVELPLDRPVAPGETVTVRMDWTSRVPRTFARTGRIGDFYFLAQWFPKIGVLEDTGWNTHQFHAATEFFADFGVYDVRLTVPTGWVGRRDRHRAVVARPRERHDDASLSAGRRARLRLDDEPRLRRARATFEHPAAGRSTCGCSCSRSTTGRRSGTSRPRAPR
jgi:hypothetical protein